MNNEKLVNHGLSSKEVQIIFDIIIQHKDKIEKVGVFGSRACNNFKDYSDIDLVVYGNVTRRDIARLNTEFIESYLGLEVDVVGYQNVDYPPFKKHIDDVVKILFSREDIINS